MPKVVRRIRTLTPEESRRMKALQRQLDEEKDEIIAIGRRFKAEHEALLAEVICGLREVKEQDGLSLADLQKRTGIDRAQLSRLLNGEAKLINPSLSTLVRIASGLGRRLKLTLAKR